MRYFFIIIGILTLLNGNSSGRESKISVEEILELKGIASASGIEATAKGIFIIGDNTPYIFLLDDNFEIKEKHLLFSESKFWDSIIEKSLKPDFEAIAVPQGDDKTLWLFGSGSGYAERDILIAYDVEQKAPGGRYPLKDFYRGLREAAGLSLSQFNIEGAEVVNDKLFLFNRGENIIFRIPLSEFQDFLEHTGNVPKIDVFRIELPEIDGINAGFSGATYVPEQRIFVLTASVENTSNWIDDGEVLGSFLGILTVPDLEKGEEPSWTLLDFKGKPVQKKVESVTSMPANSLEYTNLLLVTDSDGGISELIKVKLSK